MKIALPCRWLAFALALQLSCLPAAAAQPVGASEQDYASAKAAADADEESLDATGKAAMLQAQRAFLDAAATACATPKPDLDAFVVVMRLDGTGLVTATWRKGDSPLALCVERYARGKALPAPPRSPFHVSLEVSFER